MQKFFVPAHEIEKDLEQIQAIGLNLAQKLILLSQSIAHIFLEIRSCEDIASAHGCFDLLDKIQRTLALLVHRDDIGIPDRLWKFMSDFDNFEAVKEYYFEKIKNGEYQF
jgi:hypothetical protein